MFTGELCVYLVYLIKKCWINYRKKNQEDEGLTISTSMLSDGAQIANERQLKQNPNPALLAIPAFCDFMGSTLMFIALTMVPASVYQMMRGAINIVTPLMSILFLGRKLYRQHWIGVAFIIFGVAEVGFIAVLNSEDELGTTGSVVCGILLLLVA